MRFFGHQDEINVMHNALYYIHYERRCFSLSPSSLLHSLYSTFHLFNFDCLFASVCLVLPHPHTKPSAENGIVNCNLHLNAVKSIIFLPFCSFDLVNTFFLLLFALRPINGIFFEEHLVKLLLRMNCYWIRQNAIFFHRPYFVCEKRMFTFRKLKILAF